MQLFIVWRYHDASRRRSECCEDLKGGESLVKLPDDIFEDCFMSAISFLKVSVGVMLSNIHLV